MTETAQHASNPSRAREDLVITLLLAGKSPGTNLQAHVYGPDHTLADEKPAGISKTL